MAKTCKACGKKKWFLSGADFECVDGDDYCGVCAEKVKRDKFCQAMEPFFKEELVEEIYYNQYFSICNLADTVYGLFLFGAPTLCGVLIMPEDFEYVTTNMNNALEYVKRFVAQDDACVTLGERSVELLKALKKETAAHKPQEETETDIEACWRERSGERIKEYERVSKKKK